MDLSQAQIDAYRREGILVIERVFSPDETAVLQATLPEITDPSRLLSSTSTRPAG